MIRGSGRGSYMPEAMHGPQLQASEWCAIYHERNRRYFLSHEALHTAGQCTNSGTNPSTFK
eukprot:21652-Eustigmatos_ZCMA.PRE.1